jgi:hypothetical protein
MIRLVVTLVFAGLSFVASSPSQAFWQRSQVSHCADATSDSERARRRCYELNGYADPGWPALGIGEATDRIDRYRLKGQSPLPSARPPVRRLG